MTCTDSDIASSDRDDSADSSEENIEDQPQDDAQCSRSCVNSTSIDVSQDTKKTTQRRHRSLSKSDLRSQRSVGGYSTSTTASGTSTRSSRSKSSTRERDAATLAQLRVQAHFALQRRARREERRSKALLQQRFCGVDIEAFRKATLERLSSKVSTASNDSKELEKVYNEGFGVQEIPPVPKPRQRRRRIAIIGGGPVGLWAATLIALRHARRVRGAAGNASTAVKAAKSFIRGPDAPEIVVFERRKPEEHCSRRNVRIVLDFQTVALLNKHTKSRRFASGMALSEIESNLLEQWKRLAGPNGIVYNSHISNPMQVVENEDWDLVLWAGGRWSLDDTTRASLGCPMRVGEQEEVLVFEMRDFMPLKREARPLRADDLELIASSDLTACAHQAALAVVPPGQKEISSSSFRIMLRCANDADTPRDAKEPLALGWLWLMGLPADLKNAKTSRGSPGKAQASTKHTSLLEALDAELTRLGLLPSTDESSVSWIQPIRAATAALQEKVMSPAAVSLRWVDASYWSSDRVVCALPSGAAGQATPLVLIGDASNGKPFYTGSTLNSHIAEVKELSKLPVIRWGRGESAQLEAPSRPSRYQLAGDRVALAPYMAYEERYKALLARTAAFKRRP